MRAPLCVLAFATAACLRMPSPTFPGIEGSIGLPNRGTLAGGVSVPKAAPGLVWLRRDDRHFGVPRFVSALVRAAAAVARERPGAELAIGDLSRASGGALLPHFSHRSGRDADLLFFATTLEGEPVASPGFVSFGGDGLARDDANHRFLRFDVAREWLLVRQLMSDPDARVQWLFIHHTMRDMLLEWASARGEPPELIERVRAVMLEPNPGGAHDDHIHIRTGCTPSELRSGCEQGGPVRAWTDPPDSRLPEELNERGDLPVADGRVRGGEDAWLLSWAGSP